MVQERDLTVDPSNAEQARAWDGDEGEWWAARADRFDRSVADHHRALLDAAAIDASERILDVGCGTGQTTRDAARAAKDGSALGIDLSTRMLDVARRLAAAEGLSNVAFERGDAQIHRFAAASFDAAISRTGAMFFGDPVAAFSNIASALRPAGRLVPLAWQPLAENEWISSFSTAMSAGRDRPSPPPDAPSPFALAVPARTERLLTAAGFAGVRSEGVRAPMWFGKDVDDAFEFVLGTAGWMLDGLDHEGRARALDALRADIAAHDGADGVRYGSATWLITATRP